MWRGGLHTQSRSGWCRPPQGPLLSRPYFVHGASPAIWVACSRNSLACSVQSFAVTPFSRASVLKARAEHQGRRLRSVFGDTHFHAASKARRLICSRRPHDGHQANRAASPPLQFVVFSICALTPSWAASLRRPSSRRPHPHPPGQYRHAASRRDRARPARRGGLSGGFPVDLHAGLDRRALCHVHRDALSGEYRPLVYGFEEAKLLAETALKP